MNISVEALESGSIVFAHLGYLTVKQGRVAGHRVTVLGGNKPAIEYLVRWFGADDRATPEDWFESKRVHQTAEAAFAP